MHYFCGVLHEIYVTILVGLGMVNVIFVVRGVPNNVNYKSNLGGRK